MTCCFDPIASLWTLFQSLHHTWNLNKSTGSIPKRWEGSELPVSKISGQEALEQQEKAEQTPLWIFQIAFVYAGTSLVGEWLEVILDLSPFCRNSFWSGWERGCARVCWKWSLVFLLNEVFIGFVRGEAPGRWQKRVRFAPECVDGAEN